MAKTSDPNSATSQFFFNLANNASSLDSTNNSGGFTVFGHAIAGTNVLHAFTLFSASSPTNSIVNAGSNPLPLSELPVLTTNVSYTALIYTAIFTFQQPQLRFASLTNGVLQLSWNSNSNLLYHVEMSTNFPPVWHEIGTANGPGSSLSFLRTNRITGATLYRLRLAY
jgi:peptidyl-prolyl cis-trans isomerase A (cyclophilin A)